jgi:hypothetical protein
VGRAVGGGGRGEGRGPRGTSSPLARAQDNKAMEGDPEVRRIRQRNGVIRELLSTEQTYVRSLTLLLEGYRKPLERRAQVMPSSSSSHLTSCHHLISCLMSSSHAVISCHHLISSSHLILWHHLMAQVCDDGVFSRLYGGCMAALKTPPAPPTALQGARKKVLLAEAEVRTVFLGASDILGLQQRFLAMLDEAWAAFLVRGRRARQDEDVHISAVFDQVLRPLLCRLWRGPTATGRL